MYSSVSQILSLEPNKNIFDAHIHQSQNFSSEADSVLMVFSFSSVIVELPLSHQ